MSELGELLALLHGAHRRYRTASATVRHRLDEELAHTALARLHRFDPDPDEPVPAGITETTTRVLVEAPDRIREDGDDGTVSVECGDDWWSRSADGTVWSSGTEDAEFYATEVGGDTRLLFTPAPLISWLRLEPAGTAEVAGRRCVVAVGRPVEAFMRSSTVRALVDGDELELAVDAERGVLLRAATRLDGRDFRVVEVERIAFDEPIPAGTFER